MKVAFSTPLVNKELGKCGFCDEPRVLEHMVVDEDSRRYSICADCMNYLLGDASA